MANSGSLGRSRRGPFASGCVRGLVGFPEHEADIYGQKTGQDLPSYVQVPVHIAGGSDGPFVFAAYTRKQTYFSCIRALYRRHESSRLAGHGSRQNLDSVCSIDSSLSLRAVGGLSLEISLGTWEPDPCMYELFFSDRK